MFDFYSSREFYIVPRVAAVFLYIVFLLIVPSWYIFKQTTTIAGFLGRAVKIENLAALGDPRRAEEHRRFALSTANINNFASDKLGILSDGFTTYIDLDRSYLAAVVYATKKDSFTRREWWFPFIGRIPYKFFFDSEDARREMVKLDNRGYDVWVRRVGAISSLGYFHDPLYSFMRDFTQRELAELMIHELIHSKIFIRNNIEFNEGLAEFIGFEGSRLYIESLDEPPFDDAHDRAIRADYALYLAHVFSVINKLELVYNNHELTTEEKLQLKAGIISAAQYNFRNNYDELFNTNLFRYYPSLPVNNAFYDLYRIYHGRVAWFRELFEKSGSDLKAFIAAAVTVRCRQDPFSELERALFK